MQNDVFSSPQRQSETGMILLTLLNFGKFLRAAWPMYIFYLAKNSSENKMIWLIGFTGIVIILLAVVAFLQYRNFTYFINPKTDEFIIRSGLISRKEITIERNKIQEININQPFIHKLFNIFQLEIDSPGSEKKEVTVNAITFKNALQLKNYLLQNSDEKKISEEHLQVNEVRSVMPQVKISLGSLLKYGLTANYLRSFLTVFAFLMYLFQQILEIAKGSVFGDISGNADQFGNAVENADLQAYSWLMILIVLSVFFIFGVAGNVILNIIKYFGMKISRSEGHISLEYGLFSSKNSIVDRRKVQIISEVQNYLQQKVNILQLKFKQISDSEQYKESFTMIPGCNAAEKNDLLRYIWGDIPSFQFFIKPNIRKLIVRNAFFIALPIIISILAKPLLGAYFWLIIVYVILVEIMLVASFLNQKLYYNSDFLKLQSGIWDIEKKTVEINKIQSVKMSQYFWQKRTDLGSVKFYTAGGTISFSSAKFSALRKLVNYALWKVESSGKNWM